MLDQRFASALSTHEDSGAARDEAVAAVAAGLDGRDPDLVLCFVTHHHGEALETLGPEVARRTGARVLLGCTGESVIGGAREVEREPALSLFAASLPGNVVRPFHVTAAAGADDEPVYQGLPIIGDPARSSLLVLGEPYSFPMDHFLGVVNGTFPGVPVVGGMASGGMGPGQNLLMTGDGLCEGGAIGCVLEGDLEIAPIVSQGCRPVGEPWVVTACEQNVMLKLGGRRALDALMETLRGLDERDRALMQRQPFVGLAVDPTKSEFERGDFLVRHVTRLHRDSGAVAVADFVRRGQTIQFLVRDADSAGEDLRTLVGRQAREGSEGASTGALIFSCNGRGTRLFDRPDHDVTCVREGLAADLPVAGFFANGEIGPVGGRNFLHGYTASVALFRPRESGER